MGEGGGGGLMSKDMGEGVEGDTGTSGRELVRQWSMEEWLVTTYGLLILCLTQRWSKA